MKTFYKQCLEIIGDKIKVNDIWLYNKYKVETQQDNLELVVFYGEESLFTIRGDQWLKENNKKSILINLKKHINTL